VARLQSRILQAAGFAHAFPERGEIAIEGEPPGVGAAIVQVKQVHGAAVVEAREAAGCEADAIVARAGARPVAVGVRTADCVPVLVADRVTGDVAAIHAGWRGVVRGVVPASLARLGGRSGDCLAAIGPCIGPCCFEVGQDVAAAIAGAAAATAVTPAVPVIATQRGCAGLHEARARQVPLVPTRRGQQRPHALGDRRTPSSMTPSPATWLT
jgi:copper oxidase (laccase) domain-containing protein